MATYYVSPLGSNTAPYDTWAKAANLIQTAMSASGSGDTILVAPGVYSEAIATNGNKTVHVKCSSDTDFFDVSGIGKASNTCSINHTGWSFEGFIFSGADAGKYNFQAEKSVTFTRFKLRNGARAFRIGAATVTAAKFEIYGHTDTLYLGYTNNAATLSNWSFGIIRDNAGNIAVEAGTSGNKAFVFNHTVCVGNARYVLRNGANGVICEFNNCIETANSNVASSKPFDTSNGGIVTLNNCVSRANSLTPSTAPSVGITENNPVIATTKWKSNRRRGVLIIGLDDYNNIAQFQSLASECASRGFRAVLGLNETGSATESDWTALRALVAAGHEIASHTVDHIDLTTLGATDLAYQLTQSKADIEDGIGGGYACKTLVPPYNGTNSTVRAAVKEAGYIAARGSSADGVYDLSSLNIYNVKQSDPASIIGTTNVRKNALALCEFLDYVGGAFFLYSHANTDYSIDNWKIVLDAVVESGIEVMTFSQFAEHIIDIAATADGFVYTQTLGDAFDWRISADSRLVHGGAVITGVNDGAQSDPWGNTMLDYPNIGADQQDYAPGFGPWSTLTAPLPLSAQPCKSHALPIGTGKVTVFDGVASAAQIEEAK